MYKKMGVEPGSELMGQLVTAGNSQAESRALQKVDSWVWVLVGRSVGGWVGG
jgi:hypothetical protein